MLAVGYSRGAAPVARVELAKLAEGLGQPAITTASRRGVASRMSTCTCIYMCACHTYVHVHRENEISGMRYMYTVPLEIMRFRGGVKR